MDHPGLLLLGAFHGLELHADGTGGTDISRSCWPPPLAAAAFGAYLLIMRA